MAKLSDEDLFTLPLTFMGVPYGRPGPGNRAAILGLPFDCGIHPFRVGARGGPDAVRLQSPLIRRRKHGKSVYSTCQPYVTHRNISPRNSSTSRVSRKWNMFPWEHGTFPMHLRRPKRTCRCGTQWN